VVAEEEDLVVGYAIVTTRRGSTKARLYSICVLEEAKGRGVGKTLLAEAETLAVALGAQTMHLEVSERNWRALALYSTSGYKSFGTYHDYYGDGSSAVRMQKQLTT
jgi:ribosomal protein S18 acetylase RimI-like enzyme